MAPMRSSIVAAAFACFAVTGMATPVLAEPGIVTPRGPVLSMRDPIFMGLLISPGTSKCRQLRSYYDWKCTYGDVPRGFDRFGDRTKSGKTKPVRAAKTIKRKNLAGSAATRQ